MFKEDEPGNKRINVARTEEALDTNAEIIAAACPFCNTMLTDGVKGKDKQLLVKVFDIAELLAAGQGLETI
jgi:Fe-S oxidoreductase